MNNYPTPIAVSSTASIPEPENPFQGPQIPPLIAMTNHPFLKGDGNLPADASPVTDLLVGGDVTTTLYKYNSGDEIAKAQYSPPPGLDACKEKERTGLRPPPPKGVGSSFPFHATPEEKEERKEVLG